MENNKTPNFFLTDQIIESAKAVDFAFKSLKNEWGYSDELIMEVAKNFECATEGNIFLDILDGADGMEEAWEIYCDRRGIAIESENCPFIEEEYSR